MRFTFIAAKRAEHTVTILCRCLRVTRSGFYAWQGRAESTHARDDRRLKVLVQASFHESKQRYGSPRVHEDLIEQQERVSRKRVIRLMQEDGLKARARKRYKVTTMSDHDQPVAANLLDRQFAAERPNQKWIADFTYIWTAEGWLYVSAVIDLFSRRVVGWSTSASMTAQLVADALLMAVWRRGKPDALMHHSDRGSQRQRTVPAPDGRQRHRLQHEPIRQCLGQRGDGELLLVAEDRANRAEKLSHQERGQSRCVRLYRAVLQCDPTSFDDRIRQPC